MGKEILYCNKCGKQLSGDDFTRGRAHTFDHRQFCSACLPSQHTPKPMPAPGSGSRIAKRQASSMQLPAQGGSPAPASSSALYISLVVAAGVVILLLVLFLNPSSPPPPIAVPEPAPPRIAEPRKPTDDPARKAVEQAREFSSGNPHMVDERVRLWEQAVVASSKSEYAEEARKGMDRAIAQRREEFAVEFKAVEQKIGERLKIEQFGAVVDVLEEAKKRHESPEWLTMVSNRIREVQDTADKLYVDLKAQAIAGQLKGESARIAEARARLTTWGRRDLLAELEESLSKVVPREAPPPGATVLLRYPNDGLRKYRAAGTLKNGALMAPDYYKKAVLGGFEGIREPIAIPTEGELWITYSTNSPSHMTLRIRVIRGDKTDPYNWDIGKPEVGRPVRVKVPLTMFKDYANKYVKVGDLFGTFYIQQDDPNAELLLYEAVIFRTKE